MSTIYLLVLIGLCREQDEKLLSKLPTFRNNCMREDPTQQSTGLKSEPPEKPMGPFRRLTLRIDWAQPFSEAG